MGHLEKFDKMRKIYSKTTTYVRNNNFYLF